MASSRVSATLIAVVVIGVFGAAHAWKECSGDFCEKWMCEQNNNRKCNIAKALDPTLTDATCETGAGTDEFIAAMASCRTLQQANPTSATCAPYGDIGILYDKSTCTNPNPEDDTYVPFQLPTDTNQRVYVETTSLNVVKDAYVEDATTAVQGGCTNDVPIEGGGLYNNFTCICTASTPAQELACVNTLVEAFRTTPVFQQQYAELFVDTAAPLMVSMGVLPADATPEQQREAARQSPQLGEQSAFAGNDLFIPPESPTITRRRRLRERNLVNRMLRAPVTGA